MRLIRCLLCLAALSTVLACGDSGGRTTDAPDADATAEPVAEPAPPPAETAAMETPEDPEVAAGQMQYKLYCATCHGADGCGGGPGAAGLDPKPAKHCDGTYMNALSDEHLFKVIKEGGAAVGKSPLMTPWGGALTDDQIRDVIAYIRSIADPPYEPGA